MHWALSYDNYVERVNDTHQRDFNFRFGSVLGPTLFCTFVNDLATYLTIANLIYADDVEYDMQAFAPYLSRDR